MPADLLSSRAAHLILCQHGALWVSRPQDFVCLWAHTLSALCRCLQENKKESDFGSACKKEVEAYEQKASQDYRLNFRLRSACQGDIASLCGHLPCMKDDKVSNQVCVGGHRWRRYGGGRHGRDTQGEGIC